jgi:hypothetical protein
LKATKIVATIQAKFLNFNIFPNLLITNPKKIKGSGVTIRKNLGEISKANGVNTPKETRNKIAFRTKKSLFLTSFSLYS